MNQKPITKGLKMNAKPWYLAGCHLGETINVIEFLWNSATLRHERFNVLPEAIARQVADPSNTRTINGVDVPSWPHPEHSLKYGMALGWWDENGYAPEIDRKAEHAALLAVAEVLKRVETIPHFARESVEATRGTKVFVGRNKLADDMRQALATLAQIQKGE